MPESILFYSVAYTIWLKYATSQKIVIGAAAGALRPAIGGAAVPGSIDWQAGVLFLMVFLWTPPHFWTLALLKSADYAAARTPMLLNIGGAPAEYLCVFGAACPGWCRTLGPGHGGGDLCRAFD